MAEQPIPSFEHDEGSNVTHIFGRGNSIHERVGFVFTASDEVGEYFDGMLKPSVVKKMGQSAHFLYSQFRLPIERLEQNKFQREDSVALRAMNKALEAGKMGSLQKPLARYVTGHVVNSQGAVRLDFGVVLNESVAEQLQNIPRVNGRLPLEHQTMPVYWLQPIDDLRSVEMTRLALNYLRNKLLSENEQEPWHPAMGMKLYQPSKGDGAYVTNMRLRSKRRL